MLEALWKISTWGLKSEEPKEALMFSCGEELAVELALRLAFFFPFHQSAPMHLHSAWRFQVGMRHSCSPLPNTHRQNSLCP